MTSPTVPAPDRPAERTFGGWLLDMPRWKKIAVAAAVAAAIAGGLFSLVASEGTGGSVGITGLSSGQSGGATLVPGQPTTGQDPATTTTTPAPEPAGRGVFRLGFSFLVGFCLGSFLRSTLKIAAIAFGFWLFLTFLLAQYGILVVDWNAMQSLWNRFIGNVEQEWGSFQTFVTGSLPQAALATTGFAIGLKRH
ncbi:MAG TPA: FUN14 domain-containing protein [Planctomycetota bacterium]